MESTYRIRKYKSKHRKTPGEVRAKSGRKCGRKSTKLAPGEKVRNLLRAKKYEIGSGRKSTKFVPGEKVRNWLRAKKYEIWSGEKSRNFAPAKSTKVGPAKFRPDMESTYRVRKYKS